VASLGDYIYAKSENSIYVNLFTGSETKIVLGKNEVEVKMETNYPWEGNIKLKIDPVKKSKFKVYIRIPGWVINEIVPGGLYTTSSYEPKQGRPRIFLNNNAINATYEKGYAVVESEWKKGDILEIEFPMFIKMIESRPELKQDTNRIAIQRGPIVYCVEGTDNNGKAWNIIIPENTKFEVTDYKVLDENVKAITANVPVMSVSDDGISIKTELKKVIAIPYYTWANRGKNEMQVWLPTKITDIKLNY
jgi:DUF1680 family protein